MRMYKPNIMTESSRCRDFREDNDGPSACDDTCMSADTSVIGASSFLSVEPSFEEDATAWGSERGGSDTVEVASLAEETPDGLSTSISERRSRCRFPSTVADDPKSGDPGDRSKEDDNRGGASSTSVASVSLDESVPVLSWSWSSSSSSWDVTNANLANSMVGVTAGSSQYSRSQNSAASW